MKYIFTAIFTLSTFSIHSQIQVKFLNGKLESFQKILTINPSNITLKSTTSDIIPAEIFPLTEIEFIQIYPGANETPNLELIKSKIKPIDIDLVPMSKKIRTSLVDFNFYESGVIFFPDNESFEHHNIAMKKRKDYRNCLIVTGSVIIASTASGIIGNFGDPFIDGYDLLAAMGILFVTPIMAAITLITGIIRSRTKRRTIKKYQSYIKQNNNFELQPSKKSLGIIISF